MSDTLMKIGNSLLQHGKENDRVYLIKLNELDMPDILNKIEALANNNKYTKIFAKIEEKHKKQFIEKSYVQEAYVPNFYNGNISACFMAKYLDEQRATEENREELDRIIETSKQKRSRPALSLPKGLAMRKADYKDAPEMASLYKEVFASYPFPIHDKDYIVKTMDENVDYFGIWDGSNLIALSSCEKDIKSENAEMTDFAVNPSRRGDNLALILLKHMEEYMKNQGMKLLYTIARAKSYGMNITFSKSDYEFAGRLKNNTNISGGIESMNVWYNIL